MSLVRVELDRLVSRRLTWVAVLVVIVLLALLVLLVGQAFQASGLESDPESAPPLVEVGNPMIQISAVLGGIAIFLIGASSIGAEYTSGAIGNWLTFLPRRGEVYAAKLIAVGLSALVIGFAFAALSLGSVLALAGANSVPIVGLSELFATAGRAAAAAVVFGVVGFVLALLGRHTVVALGALIAYGVIAFIRNVMLFGSTSAQRLGPLTPELNLAALLNNGASYFFVNEEIEKTVSVTSGTLYLTVFTALFAVIGWLVFRRRDVS